MRLLLTFLFSIIVGFSYGQLNLKWANQIDASTSELVIGTDSEGNVYSIDYFYFDFDADPGPGITTLIDSDYQYYIQKLDSNGQFQWAYTFLDTGVTRINDIFVKANGDIYLTGRNHGTTDFAPGATTYLDGDLNFASFILKLDSDANFLWVKLFPSTAGSNGSEMSVFVDENDFVYLTGNFADSTILDISPDTVFIIDNGAPSFMPGIIKLDEFGNYVNHVSYENNSLCKFRSPQVRGDNLYITGEFMYSFDFDPSSTTNIVISPNYSSFLLKMDTALNYQWVKIVHDSYYTNGAGISLDENENIYCVGEYRGNAIFDPGGQNISYNGNGTSKMYIQKFRSNGDFEWLKTFGQATEMIRAFNIESDSIGNFYICGMFYDYLDFNNDNNNFNYLDPSEGWMFLVSYDTSGNFNFARNFKGNNSGQDNFSISDHGSIYISNDFFIEMDADPGENVFLVQNPTNYGRFTLKLDQCSNYTTIYITDTVCSYDGYTLGSIEPDSSGFYSEVFNSANGCDSIVNLNLWLTNVDANLTIQGDGGLLASGGSTYEWFDCDISMVIPVATGNSFYPPYYGNFALVSHAGNCSDTSSCLFYNSINDINSLNGIKIVPNPFSERLELSQLPLTNSIIELISLEGQVILQMNSNNMEKMIISTDKLSNGIYFIRIESECQSVFKKIVKVN